MRKTYLMLVVINLLGSSVYAGQPTNPTEDPADIKQFYCPEIVTCGKFNDPSSCTFKTDDSRYWGELKFNGFVLADTYNLDSVVSSFHSPNVEPVSCVYTVKGYSNYQLSISSKKESNLEIFYMKPTNWIFSSAENSFQGVCTTTGKSAQSCPLKEQPALTLYNLNIGSGVIASINNNVISNVLTSQYGKVNYDAALVYCRGVKECRINLESSQGVFYGDVTVDMFNNMKILKVSSITPLADISQLGSYNAVEVSHGYH